MKAPSKKPKGVPAKAWFHEEWGEWIFGQKVKDACVGEWHQWHPTKGHLTCIDLFDKKGSLTFVTRFHADGTPSQKVPHRNGQPHGEALYQRSKKPSDDRSMENCPAKGAFSMKLTWDNGEQTVPARFFDAKEREINIAGVPKPKGVPELATSNEDGFWHLGEENLQKQFKGHAKTWRADGTLREEQWLDAKGNHVRSVEYFADGSVAREVDYAKKKGFANKPSGKTDISLAKFPGAAQRMTFAVRYSDRKTGTYLSEDPRFFDAAGCELTIRGTSMASAPKSATLVTDGSSYQPQQYWKTTTKSGKDTVDRYDRLDGKTYLEVVTRGKSVTELRFFDEKGKPFVVERLHPTKKDKRKRRIATSLTVHLGAETQEVACDDAGRITSITAHEGKTKKVLFDAKKLGKLDSPGCGRVLKESFGKLIKQSGLVLAFDYCEIARLEMQTEKKYFAATAFTGDGGGNSAIAIDEGKHEGKMFFLDHEEGLFSLDCVDDVLEDEEIDPKKLSRDKLVEAMPFFHNPLAATRTDFLRGLSLRTNLTYYDKLVRFVPVRKAR